MSEWKEEANKRRDFRHTKDAPEAIPHRSKKKKPKGRYKVVWKSLRFNWTMEYGPYKKLSEAEHERDKLNRTYSSMAVAEIIDTQEIPDVSV